MTNKSTKFIAGFGLMAGIGVAAALPLAMAQPGHAATTADTTINAVVGDSISISTGTYSTITLDNIGVNETKTAEGGFTVATNHASGYTVSVKGNAASGDATALTMDASNAIPYSASAVAAGTAGWNLSLNNVIPASIAEATNIVEQGQASAATGDAYTVKYNVATSSNQAAGTYVGKVTYTAAVNPAP